LSGEARRALPGEGVLNPNNCIPPSPPISCLLESGESKIGFPAPFLYPLARPRAGLPRATPSAAPALQPSQILLRGDLRPNP